MKQQPFVHMNQKREAFPLKPQAIPPSRRPLRVLVGLGVKGMRSGVAASWILPCVVRNRDPDTKSPRKAFELELIPIPPAKLSLIPLFSKDPGLLSE